MKLPICSALFVASLIVGCGSKPPAPAQPTPSATEPPVMTTERKTIAQDECERGGGVVVGDIGDGATHRPDYVCPSGKPPLGNVPPAAAGAIAIEGAVCCPR